MRARLTIIAAMLMAATRLAVCAAQQSPAEPIATATRQNAFTIPFRIEPTASPADQPVEAQLHVSTDQGATWNVSSRVPPQKQSFVFRAPHDGEYWFSIRTLDAQGVTRPSGPMYPQLKVSVDTVAPRLDLSVSRGPGGEIVARWQAVDPNLRLDSFSLEYQGTSTGPWEPVAVKAPPPAMKHTLSGEAIWWASASGPILVRAKITDLAGNPAVTQAVVKPGDPNQVPPTAAAAGMNSQPAGADGDGWRPGDTTPTTGDDSRRWPPDRSVRDPLAASTRPNESPSYDPAQPSNLPDSAYSQGSVSQDSTSRGNSSDITPLDSYASDSAPAGFVPDARPRTQPQALRQPQQVQRPVAESRTAESRTVETRTPESRTVARSVSQSRNGRPGSPLDFTVLPAAVRPRMVASPRFELEYEIESVGPSGVGKVELWGTRDGGRTWSDYAVDTDLRSPMPVEVAGEGIFGFRIVVQSGTGFGSRPPAEGDLPDIWIGVDLTKPTCQITGTEVSADGTQLLVTWEAADDVLDPRPVSLLFSETAAGPWTPIASGLENSGSYRWKLDNRVPPRILLRLEVRDEAGNIGTHDLGESILLDRHRPEGKIRGVRAIPQQ